jgi:hypothetical protein
MYKGLLIQILEAFMTGSRLVLNTLTVFSKTASGYKAVASFQLTGEANLSSVKDGIITLDQKVYAKNDPVCCPTIKKKARYRWAGKKISEVTK